MDEAYLDVTEDKLGMGSAVRIAEQIRERIYNNLHLTASAGVSINKFLAKVASDLNKPNGLSLIAPEQAEAFLEALPIEEFYGVGPATAAKMKANNIHNGADLKQWSQAQLVQTFGKVGNHYYRVVRAQDNRPVNPNRIRKSIGAEKSFSKDLRSLAEMEQALARIAADVQGRLQKHKRSGYTITLKIKYNNYDTVTRSRTLETPIADEAEILRLARSLLETHLERDRPVRLLGITLSNLIECNTHHQLSLNLI